MSRISAIQGQLVRMSPVQASTMQLSSPLPTSTGTFADALAGATAPPSVAASSSTATATATTAPPPDTWQLPVQGRVTSPFGMRTHPVTGVYKLHTGTDFAAATGTPIGAASGGIVRSAGYQNGNGNTVIIDHGNGISTLYGHASELLVTPGQRVEAGQEIAKAGSTGYATGPHVHLEVRKDDKPMNPLPWLREHGVKV